MIGIPGKMQKSLPGSASGVLSFLLLFKTFVTSFNIRKRARKKKMRTCRDDSLQVLDLYGAEEGEASPDQIKFIIQRDTA